MSQDWSYEDVTELRRSANLGGLVIRIQRLLRPRAARRIHEVLDRRGKTGPRAECRIVPKLLPEVAGIRHLPVLPQASGHREPSRLGSALAYPPPGPTSRANE